MNNYSRKKELRQKQSVRRCQMYLEAPHMEQVMEAVTIITVVSVEMVAAMPHPKLIARRKMTHTTMAVV